MLTDGPEAEPDGLRIAAARAGEQGDGGWDDEDGGGTDRKRRRARTSRRERQRQALAAAPTATPPLVARRPGPVPRARDRQKVLRQRRRRRRALISFILLAMVATFVTGVGYVYLQRGLGRISRLDVASVAGDAPGAAVNVLLVGTDSKGESPATAQTPGLTADTIEILRVDPGGRSAAIVAVPSELYVPLGAGGAGSERVGATFTLGGPDRLVATLRSALGVTINHYVQIDLAGFKGIVDALGGVRLYLPYPARDAGSGLALERAGCVKLDGGQSLAWARGRQVQFLVNGTWQPEGRGDLGRIGRQQDLLRRVLRKALATGMSNPVRLNRLVNAGARDVILDSSLSDSYVSALGRRYGSLGADQVALQGLPTSPVQLNGNAVQLLRVAEARPLVDVLNGKAPIEVTTPAAAGAPASAPTGEATPKPGDVMVRVLNGLGAPGAATKAADSLTALGFKVADKGDAPSTSAKTTILYGAGRLAKAQLLQRSLVTSAVLKEDATLQAVDVNLVLGGDYTGVKAGISSGASSAPTTAPPATAAPAAAVPPAGGASSPAC